MTIGLIGMDGDGARGFGLDPRPRQAAARADRLAETARGRIVSWLA